MGGARRRNGAGGEAGSIRDAPGWVASVAVIHIGWSPVDAKLIDQRMLKRTTDSSQAATSQVWEYLVEIAGTDGTAAVRLTIKEETFKLKLPGVGGHVPVLVNKKRTKAMFNLKDPRID